MRNVSWKPNGTTRRASSIIGNPGARLPDCKDVVERLHAKKVKVIGATVVSSFGSPIGSYGFPKVDTERKKLNDFIRTSGLFDAVADFDAATLDPATGAMKAPMQPNGTTGGPGELLHPNRVGYQAMAETIDLKLLAPSPLQKVLAVSSANAEI